MALTRETVLIVSFIRDATPFVLFIMEYFNMPKDTLATHSELARAQLDIFQPIMTPPPDALQLPPYQETEDSFLVWSAVLPPPPMHMRGFGMSEFLWACFFDWMWTADELKWILLERIALGYRLRWPHRQVLIRTPEQLSWIRRHPPGPPRHIISVLQYIYLQGQILTCCTGCSGLKACSSDG